MPAAPPYSRRRRVVIAVALVYPVLLLCLSLWHTLAPQRSGLLALTQVFAPYLFLPLLLLVPLMFMRGAAALRIVLGLCLLLYCVQFMPVRVPVTLKERAAPGALHVEVMNWNVQNSIQLDSIGRVRPVLVKKPADVVALEESYWEWMDRDPELKRLYPYRLVHTTQASSGLVLLSSYPIIEHAVPELPPNVRGWPRLIKARLDLGGGRTLTVVAAHPEAPRNLRFDTSERQALIPYIRAFVNPALQGGEPLILAGDFNTTEREPAYSDISAGLQDAYRVVGVGGGNTWPALSLWGHDFALLQIDHLFSSPGVVPLNAQVDCTPRGSDHCIVHGGFAIEGQKTAIR